MKKREGTNSADSEGAAEQGALQLSPREERKLTDPQGRAVIQEIRLRAMLDSHLPSGVECFGLARGLKYKNQITERVTMATNRSRLNLASSGLSPGSGLLAVERLQSPLCIQAPCMEGTRLEQSLMLADPPQDSCNALGQVKAIPSATEFLRGKCMAMLLSALP